MTSNEIRKAFLDYFESKGHHVVPSAPMVIKNDPTLMFTNAGMNQFKDIFLGNQQRQWPRATDSQKCLRVSGKHNDLEEVGHDTYHHTMFEMLGNWSFGDYFKKEAIAYGWEFLTEVMKINKDWLYVTVFGGDEKEGLGMDTEAYDFWKEHISEDRILKGSKKDNFWEMGDQGPCGPCSEIHVDIRPDEEKAKVPGKELVNKDNPQVIEIWNLVFMQYNRKADGSLEPLKAKHIDTGMGFERLCMVMQGKRSNYDTDVFQPLIQELAAKAGKTYGKDEETDIALRVCADHLRAVSFSIADGQLPSNVKAGYVIRRILRRAVRYAYTFLGQKEAFMYKLVPTLVDEMGDSYPELKAQKELIIHVIKEEEDAFLRTLATGVNMLDDIMAEAKKAGSKEISGVKAFTLFDTFGFPLDLTELICSEHGLKVDEKSFNEEMQKQKDRARGAAKVETGDWITVNEGEEKFVGWDTLTHKCHITRYRAVVQKNKKHYEIVLDVTPFYAEMGGQVGDRGRLVSAEETIDIVDTKRENNLALHITNALPKHPEAEFTAEVDKDWRAGSEANHTATHLLDYALRSVLGTHVEQKGSLVMPDYLRFDFSHFQKVTPEEIRQVERIVNAAIRADIPLEEHRDMPLDEAKKMGAIALFGEKYGNKVRVVKFGHSIELCGGCHAHSTGRLGLFHILSESSVAAGVRRIEAITGKAAEELMYKQQDILEGLSAFFNNAKDLKAAARKTIEENSSLHKQIEAYMQRQTEELAASLVKNAEKRPGGVTLIKKVLPVSPDVAKNLAFKALQAVPEGLFCILGSIVNNKPMLTLMISKDLIKDHNLNAGQIIRNAAKLIGGGGGGAPHFATAGGHNADGLNAAVDKAVEEAGI